MVLASPALLATLRQTNRAKAAASSSGAVGKMKRVGCTTVCFRARFPSTRPKNYPGTKPDLGLLDVPDFFAEKLGVHNVELWSKHFDERSLKYCQKIKKAGQRAGSVIVNIQLDEPGYNLSHRDAAERKNSVEFVKRWMDRAAACGATSLRANTGGGPKFDVDITADSYRQLAECGQKINVKILIENHGGHSGNPDNIVAIIKAVDSPWCRSLPDFGNVPTNSTQQQRDEFLKKLYPYAHLVSAKGMYFDEEGNHLTYDIGGCVRFAEANGFKGIYSAEQWSPKPIRVDDLTASRRIIQEIVRNL